MPLLDLPIHQNLRPFTVFCLNLYHYVGTTARFGFVPGMGEPGSISAVFSVGGSTPDVNQEDFRVDYYVSSIFERAQMHFERAKIHSKSINTFRSTLDGQVSQRLARVPGLNTLCMCIQMSRISDYCRPVQVFRGDLSLSYLIESFISASSKEKKSQFHIFLGLYIYIHPCAYQRCAQCVLERTQTIVYRVRIFLVAVFRPLYRVLFAFVPLRRN